MICLIMNSSEFILFFFGLICALGTDSGAQLGGMAFGKHKMSPNISPKKQLRVQSAVLFLH